MKVNKLFSFFFTYFCLLSSFRHNQIDHQRAEGALEIAFKDVVAQIGNPNVRYEAFDFHHECRHMRWDRLNILMDRLAHDLEQMRYFLLTKDGILLSAQEGVFRTNCIDCLDRTNVVQSMLAKKILVSTLCRLGVLKSLEDHPSFENLFKQVYNFLLKRDFDIYNKKFFLVRIFYKMFQSFVYRFGLIMLMSSVSNTRAQVH